MCRSVTAETKITISSSHEAITVKITTPVSLFIKLKEREKNKTKTNPRMIKVSEQRRIDYTQ